MKRPRKRCDYPLSDFYIFEDEVPYGVRVSTPKDCKDCDGFDAVKCIDREHCLIEEASLPLPHPCPDE